MPSRKENDQNYLNIRYAARSQVTVIYVEKPGSYMVKK